MGVKQSVELGKNGMNLDKQIHWKMIVLHDAITLLEPCSAHTITNAMKFLGKICLLNLRIIYLPVDIKFSILLCRSQQSNTWNLGRSDKLYVLRRAAGVRDQAVWLIRTPVATIATIYADGCEQE